MVKTLYKPLRRTKPVPRNDPMFKRGPMSFVPASKPSAVNSHTTTAGTNGDNPKPATPMDGALGLAGKEHRTVSQTQTPDEPENK